MNREAWGKGWMSRERKRQSLGQERPPRSPKRSNFTKDPRESQRRENQMVTPLGDIIDRDTLSQQHCAHLMPTMCIGKQLPEGTIARRNSCLTEKRDAEI